MHVGGDKLALLSCCRAALQAEGQGMAPAQPPELAVALLPFARTPSRPQPQPRSNPEQRAK